MGRNTGGESERKWEGKKILMEEINRWIDGQIDKERDRDSKRETARERETASE